MFSVVLILGFLSIIYAFEVVAFCIWLYLYFQKEIVLTFLYTYLPAFPKLVY